MIDFGNLVKSALMGVILTMTPLAASAVTLTINDVGIGGLEVNLTDSPTVNFSGTAGGFTIAIASTNLTSDSNSHVLNTTSIQTHGVGTLIITATETGLTNFSAPFIGLEGTGSVSDVSRVIKISHYIDTGSGFTLIGDMMNFFAAGGNSQSATVSGGAPTIGTFDLRTVIRISTTQSDQLANVNATLIAAVPVPAAGLLLLTALGGLGLARRRRRAA